jgi:hypothetical protein
LSVNKAEVLQNIVGLSNRATSEKTARKALYVKNIHSKAYRHSSEIITKHLHVNTVNETNGILVYRRLIFEYKNKVSENVLLI